MDSGYLLRKEHEEFALRMQEENDRQNHRLAELEGQGRENHKLLLSIERLATNMESLQKEVNEQGKRLETIENRDGETWRNVKWYVLIAVVGAVVGYALHSVGL